MKLTKLITLTIAVTALVCATGLLQPVKGQTGDGSATSVSYTSLGIVPGQTVRLSVASDEKVRRNNVVVVQLLSSAWEQLNL